MSPEELTELNHRLRLLGWTDRAIAQAIGVQPRTLRRMENGQRPIFDDQAETLRKLVEEGEAERAARIEAVARVRVAPAVNIIFELAGLPPEPLSPVPPQDDPCAGDT